MTSPATAELRPFTPEVEIARAPENPFETDEEVHAAMPPFEHSSELDPSNAETESKVSTEFPYIVLESGIYAQDENGEPLLHMPLILDTDQAAIFNEVMALLEPATVETKLDPSFGFGDDEHEAWSVQTYVPKGYDAHGNQLMTIVATMELRLIELLEEPEVEDGDSGITDTAELAETVKNHEPDNETQPDDGDGGGDLYVAVTETAETEKLETGEAEYGVIFESDADTGAVETSALTDDSEEIMEKVDTVDELPVYDIGTESLSERTDSVVEEITTEETPVAAKSEESMAEAEIEDINDSLVIENEAIVDTPALETTTKEAPAISSETTVEEIAPTISSADTDTEGAIHQKTEEKITESVTIDPETIAEQPKREAISNREEPKREIVVKKTTAEASPSVLIPAKIEEVEEKAVFVQLRQKPAVEEKVAPAPAVNIVKAQKEIAVAQTAQNKQPIAEKQHATPKIEERFYHQPAEVIAKKPITATPKEMQEPTKTHFEFLSENNFAPPGTSTYSYSYPPQEEAISSPKQNQRQQQTTSQSFDHHTNLFQQQISYSFSVNDTTQADPTDLVFTFSATPRGSNPSQEQLQVNRV
jgi:ABC-type molybdate transport system substrate-binding protein